MQTVLRWITDPQSAWFVAVATPLIKATLLLTTAWLIHFALANNNPRWRVLLWRSTTVGILILGVLSACPPLMTLAILPSLRDAGTAAIPLNSSESIPISDAVLDRSSNLPASYPSSASRPVDLTKIHRTGPATPPPLALSESAVATPDKILAQPPAPQTTAAFSDIALSRSSMVAWTIGIWLTGCLAGVVSMFAGWWRLSVIRRTSSPVDSLILAEAESAARALHLRDSCDVRQTSDLPSPCLVGIWRPLVLLVVTTDCTTQQRDLPSIIAHELAHLKGRDLIWNAVVRSLSIIFWFHPLMWRVRSAHIDACDAVCDALAANYVGDPTTYCRTLARLTLQLPANRLQLGLAMARNSSISRRIEALRKRVCVEGLPGLPSAVCKLSAIVAAAILGSVTLSASRAEQPQPVKPDRAALTQPKTESNPQAEKKPELAPVPVLEGTVLLPDGSPAANAKVALSTEEIPLYLADGKVDDRRIGKQALVVTADKAGRYKLLMGTATGPYVVMAWNDIGVADATRAELQKSTEFKLQAWGRIKGRSLHGTQPDTEDEIRMYQGRERIEALKGWSRDIYAAPTFEYKTKPDANGEFTIDRVLPGKILIGRMLYVPHPTGGGGMATSGWSTQAEVKAGETADLQIGGTGRPVTGKLIEDSKTKVAIDWTKVSEPLVIEEWDAIEGALNRTSSRFAGRIDPSGAFRVWDVAAGHYKFFAPVPGNNQARSFRPDGAQFEFTIPEIPDGRSDEPFDLGNIECFRPVDLNVGDAIPSIRVPGLHEGMFNIDDYRGKLIVLDFWSPASPHSIDLMKERAQLRQQFKGHPRIAFVAVASDHHPDVARDFSQKNGFDLPQGHIDGPQSRIAREYNVGHLPASYLIAPDATVLSKNLNGEIIGATLDNLVKDEELFDIANGKKRRRFPIVRYSLPDQTTPTTGEPAVLVVDDVDGDINKGAAQSGRIRLLTEAGAAVWAPSPFHRLDSRFHRAAVDRPRNRIYITEERPRRLIALDLQGRRHWHIEGLGLYALAVDDKTGNVWCCRGIKYPDMETVVFSPQGDEVAVHSQSGFHIAFDPHSDAFWMIADNKRLTKVNRNGEKLFDKSMAQFMLSSVSVNPTNGQVWIVERGHATMPGSKNRLWLLNSDGSVVRDWDFGELMSFSVTTAPSTNQAWMSFLGDGGIRRVSSDGTQGDMLPFWTHRISISPATGNLWFPTDEAVFKLDPNGKTLLRLPNDKPSRRGSSNAWVQAL